MYIHIDDIHPHRETEMSRRSRSGNSNSSNEVSPESIFNSLFSTELQTSFNYHHSHRHQEQIIFDKELFVKSKYSILFWMIESVHHSFRFILNKSVNQKQYLEQLDAPIIWSDVKYVECTVPEDNCCPICLNAVKLPRVSCCGHIYWYIPISVF